MQMSSSAEYDKGYRKGKFYITKWGSLVILHWEWHLYSYIALDVKIKYLTHVTYVCITEVNSLRGEACRGVCKKSWELCSAPLQKPYASLQFYLCVRMTQLLALCKNLAEPCRKSTEPCKAIQQLNLVQEPCKAMQQLNLVQEPSKAMQQLNHMQESCKAMQQLNHVQEPSKAMQQLNHVQESCKAMQQLNLVQEHSKAMQQQESLLSRVLCKNLS